MRLFPCGGTDIERGELRRGRASFLPGGPSRPEGSEGLKVQTQGSGKQVEGWVQPSQRVLLAQAPASATGAWPDSALGKTNSWGKAVS